jgi:hypothetical protein
LRYAQPREQCIHFSAKIKKVMAVLPKKQAEHHHNHSWQIFYRSQQVSRLASQTIPYPAFSGYPNDWLSPTDMNLDAHGIG